MINATQRSSSSERRNIEEQPLDKIIKNETLEKLVDILRSFGKEDAEIEESLVKDLGLPRQRLKRFLKLESTDSSNQDGHRV